MMDAASEGVHASMEATQRADGKFRAIMEAAPVPMVVTRASDGVVLYASSRLEPTFGVSPDVVVGRPAADFYLDGPSHEELLARLRESGGYIRDLEVSGRKVDGTPAWVVASVQQMEYGGEPALLTGIHDITERKRAEEALRESEGRWRSILKNIPDIVMTLDRDGTILFINRTPPGSTVEATIGAVVYDHVPPEHHDTLRRSLERVFEAGEALDYEIAAPGPFGMTSWYFNRIGPVMAHGGVAAVVVIATDITERKRAEEALRQSEERYRDLAENLNDAIFEFDASGRMTYISSGMQRVSGYSPSEIIGRPFTQLVHPEDLQAVTDRIRRRPFGDRNPSEYRLLGKSGEARWVQSLGQPIFERDQVVGFRAVLTDITERKQMEAELQKIREALDSTTERQMERGNLHGLTFREMTVLNLITEGKADKEIATILGISFLTARKHAANILSKMGVSSRTQAAVEAVRQGLLD
jgi:PAS domain S-box-containing protein